jgi:hypothetical protein
MDYRDNPELPTIKGVNVGRRSGVKIPRRLTGQNNWLAIGIRPLLDEDLLARVQPARLRTRLLSLLWRQLAALVYITSCKRPTYYGKELADSTTVWLSSCARPASRQACLTTMPFNREPD